MYLKKLTLNGFKSFADKTELDILPGITSIVGPNGCGKSNIVDAISWVLGEQRIRILRGHKMEDVIFKGSSTRPAVGMAEVSLTFDNSDGRLPLDFSEVTITRRVFRSGESNYLINNKNCRLRDIDELILGTGLGSRSYAVVEQGRIDQILQSRPEDRRELLEEAAGISKYRKKKEEALRKLEHTRNNLLRVEDIVREVSRQLNVTRRQASRAERYRRYRERLRELEISLSQFQFHKLELQSVDLGKNESALKEECRSQEEKIRGAENELAARRQERREGEDKVNRIRARLLNQQAEIEKSRQMMDLNRERIHDLEIRRERLQREIDQFQILIEKNRVDGEEMRLEVDKIKEVNQEKSIILSRKEGELSEQSREYSAIRKELAEARNLSFESSRVESLTRNEYLSLQARNKERILRQRKLEVELEKLTAEEEELKTEIDRVEGIYQGVVREVKRLNQDLEEARKQGEKLEREAKARAEEREELSLDLKEKESWLQAWEKESGVSAINSGALIVEAAASPGSRISGIIGPLKEFIKPAPGFEKAVQAALGEKEEAVVVREVADALHCIEFLRKRGGGPVTFIIAAELRKNKERSISLSAGEDTLADHVRLLPPLAGLERSFFPGILLIKELSPHPESASGQVYITPEGDRMVFPGLLYWRGESSSPPELTPQELSRQITASREKLEQVAIRLPRLASRVKESRADYEKIRERLHHQDTGLAVSENELGRWRKNLEKIGLSRLALREEISSLRREQEENTGREKELALRLENPSGSEEDLPRKLPALQQLAAEKESDVRHQEAAVTDLKISLASSREREDLLRGQLSRLGERGAEVDNSRKERLQEIEQGKARKNELGQAIKALELVWKEGGTKLEGLQTELRLLEERTSRLVQECKEKEDAYRDIRPSFQEAQGRLNSQQVKLAEMRWQKENLIEKIRENYRVELRDIPLPEEEIDPEDYSREIEEVKAKLEKMPNVNLAALEEQDGYETRLKLLTEQQSDLEGSTKNLEAAIKKINVTAGEKLRRTYEVVREEFRRLFSELFQGGEADLILDNEKNILDSGLEIVAQPPGKKQTHLSLLSGGEKAMTSIALIFSLFKVQPSPFYLLDEIDAPLDEANIGRFVRLLQELVKSAQFVVITHNKRTIREADILYGITMQESGVSKLISVKLAEAAPPPEKVDERMAKAE